MRLDGRVEGGAGLADALVRVVAAGEALLAPEITRRLIDRYVSGAPPYAAELPRLARLTAREREVLTLIARGLSNAEIAREMCDRCSGTACDWAAGSAWTRTPRRWPRGRGLLPGHAGLSGERLGPAAFRRVCHWLPPGPWQTSKVSA